MDFEELAKSRQSALNFVSDFKMEESDFKKIFELTKFAPSAYNLQSTNYLVVLDEGKKELIHDLSYAQYKIKTASAIVIVLGNKRSLTLKSAQEVYLPMKMLKIMSDDDYELIMKQISEYIGNLDNNPSVAQSELNKVCSINVAFFILSAKHYGFDTCIMHTHNETELRKEFNIPNDQEIMMMIAVGKSVDKKRPRGYRRPVSEIVTFNKFK